ncbi:type I pullulanase [Alkalihalobacillus sp. MEB130]|uniref:type I pullulanase n=1 Tax=Alkalihalobacillus sp. MEB130 TaxID=2976704 RepID=UPI0028DDA941|nr:type I pullulanase [Alkalihalobacillus sp. MEB130]MDT8859344.1 type I pullulanase [Alkalihalobacillus sp. MEB130]
MKQKKESFVNHQIKSAILLTMDTIRVTLEPSQSGDAKNWKIANEGGEWPLTIIEVADHTIDLLLSKPYDFDQTNIVVCDSDTCYVEVRDVVRTDEFDDFFYYSGNDLGVTYTKEQTKVAVWAPIATKVNILLYKKWHDETGERYTCSRDGKGVWRAELDGDYESIWYLFEVYVNQSWRKVIDPYAKFLSINGQKAMIGDHAKTQLAQWPKLEPLSSPNDMIIYELHIRDFTIGRNNGIKHKGQFVGMTEEGTMDPHHLITGIDYLERMGITHVELLPVQEFGSIDESNRQDPNHYNWGYDTTHFFVPEGSYATDPYDGYSRNRELKLLIASLHKKQIRVIMDVVFNHLYIWEDSPLEQIVPGYFFRHTDENEMSNGTGVGNDFAAERNMARKMIVDAISYWIEEFHVDGFRFDLMGILDTETMKQVAKETKKATKDIFILGEGWDLPTSYPPELRAITDQARELPQIAFFQDRFRDGIKGSTFESIQPGFVSGNDFSIDEIVSGVRGSMELFSSPKQAINYVEAHDNHTLWDKLKEIHPHEETELLQKRHRLATSIVMLSQGIPFLHAGQEWFRTKYGCENSYNQPDWVNQFDWNQRAYFEKTVNYIRGLIKIRRAHPAFRMETYKAIKEHFHLMLVESDCIAYHLRNLGELDRWDDIIVIHNASLYKKRIPLPKNTDWYVVVDDHAASLIPLSKIGEDCVNVSPLSTWVCVNYKTK